jgi:hypothetical protein
MTTLREAAAQALDALTKIHPGNMSWETGDAWLNAVQILREALNKSDPEPVAWMTINPYGEEDDISYEDPTMDLLDGWTCKPLYTQPPQREWIGLTDAELEEFSNMQLGAYDLCDAVEERLEEKNRG